MDGLAVAQDVGRVLNPRQLAARIEAGVTQGAGLALMEDLRSPRGVIKRPSLTGYPLPTALDAPDVRIVRDRVAFEGPLTGLLAGLLEARAPLVMVVGGDMPTLVGEVLAATGRRLPVSVGATGLLRALPVYNLRTAFGTYLVGALGLLVSGVVEESGVANASGLIVEARAGG